jgi:antitoxin YefM
MVEAYASETVVTGSLLFQAYEIAIEPGSPIDPHHLIITSRSYNLQVIVHACLSGSRSPEGRYLNLMIAGRTMTCSESRATYAKTPKAVVNDPKEVVITRAGHESVVIASLEDYQSLKETAYLLRSPENARRLLASIARLESGAGVERGLSE